jgi:DNA-directed RNA polymerase subunit RPC12/RpoP
MAMLTAVPCALVGHDVNDLVLDGDPGRRRCRCGEPFLDEDGSLTRIRHTLECFLFGHRLHRIASRDGHAEYLCALCGHPLLFRADRDPFAGRAHLRKKPRYACNLFGHAVDTVVQRGTFTEYACRCGHTFLAPEAGALEITHPPICTLAGHFIRFVCRRDGHAEYRCTSCGHPFCFPVA